MGDHRICFIGTVGVPAVYGGFETLVDNLVGYHYNKKLPYKVTVYCSSRAYKEKCKTYKSAALKYIPIKANGIQSIPYDIFSLISAIWNRNEVVVLLGVSGAIALPFLRLVSSIRIITNIDGIEWRRDKWSSFARWLLRISEYIAVRFSHCVISDNEEIQEYVQNTYNVSSIYIAYGGDHVLTENMSEDSNVVLPDNYVLSICRIEPENNIHIILETFSQQNKYNLIIVGNWQYSEYGSQLYEKYSQFSNIGLLGPIYDVAVLAYIRRNATLYVHGHSAGGTNPSLVEAMYSGLPVIAYDCDYNRNTTQNKSFYFSDGFQLQNKLTEITPSELQKCCNEMKKIAFERYKWDIVAKSYFDLINGEISR